jgi:glycosyltransferase involved in cell wall biosynthesis
MLNQKRVSMIVPVYKVENYLSRCIESLIAQTYQNIEIILVNDGSPDSCGEMIEYYADHDQRIIPIHKENGGVSEARNTGMAYASGEYTFFVDGDDWIAPTLVTRLVEQMEQCNADVVQTAHYYAYQEYLLYDDRFEQRDDSPVVLDNHQLMRELVLNQVVKNFAWGKLYKTELIIDILFQEGIFFEDVFWSHLVMQRVHTYVITHEPLYYYYQHEDSIVGSFSEKNLDFLKSLKQRHKFLEKHYSHLVEDSYKEIAKAHMIHYQLLLKYRKIDPAGLYRTEIVLYIRQNFSLLYKAIQQDKELKQELTFFHIHPYLYIVFLSVKKGLRMMHLLPKPQGLERMMVTEKNG